MAADTPTAHSILTSFLLTSTSYTLPSLPSLRSLDSRLPDSDLKQAHRELLQHRNGLRAQLQQNINQYQLLPKEAVQQLKRNAVNKREEEEGDEGEDEEYLTLEQVMQRLEQEEKELGAEVQELNGAVEDQKALLDAFADRIETTATNAAPTPPSVKRELEATLGELERDVKKYRGLVDEINRQAGRS